MFHLLRSFRLSSSYFFLFFSSSSSSSRLLPPPFPHFFSRPWFSSISAFVYFFSHFGDDRDLVPIAVMNLALILLRCLARSKKRRGTRSPGALLGRISLKKSIEASNLTFPPRSIRFEFDWIFLSFQFIYFILFIYLLCCSKSS